MAFPSFGGASLIHRCTDDPEAAEQQGDDINGLFAVISSLSNGTTYYVWLKAKNDTGTSGFSPSASAKPIGDMGALSIESGNGYLSVSWSAVAGADQYEVYYDTGATILASPAQTVSATTTVINGLSNGTTYYVWVRPKNAYAPGGTNAVAVGTPQGATDPTGMVGLYLNGTKIGDHNVSESLAYIYDNGVDGDNFQIIVGADEYVSSTTIPNIAIPKNVTVTLKGHGAERKLTHQGGLGSMFALRSGATLILDENITLIGYSGNTYSLVEVSQNSQLIINDGAKITGSQGGGVDVNNGGTFTMNGGEISGNSANGIGGGVYLFSNGTFRIVEGTIYGSDEAEDVKNTASSGGAALSGTAQHGTFSGETWNNEGDLDTTNNTIRVVGGNLQ